MTSNHNETIEITDILYDDRKFIIPKEENKGVLVIYTGGTIGSIPKDPNDPGSPMVVAKWQEFRNSVPNLNLLPFTIDACSFVEPLDSANVGPAHWITMAKIIGRDNYDNYEGFVILHGTDTMVYTASALSFMLQDIGKPVIITGSQKPAIGQVRNDAEQNLVTSIMIANSNYSNVEIVQEVCIFFRDKLLRGNRTRKLDASGYTAFDTPNYHVLGTAGDSIDIEEEFLHKPEGEFTPIYSLSTDLIMIDLFPGFQGRSKIRDLVFDPKIFKAVVLKTYGTGNVPTESDDRLFNISKEVPLIENEDHETPNDMDDLEIGCRVSNSIRDIFRENDYRLSKDARIFRMNEKCWEVSDRKIVLEDVRYKIVDKESAYEVYEFSFLDDIQMAVRRGQIIVNVTQCPWGQVEQGLYDTSAVLTDRGVLSGQEITPEAALCKLMVKLGHAEEEGLDINYVIEEMSKNISGEQDFSIFSTILRKGKVISGNNEKWKYRVPETELRGLPEAKDTASIERAILRFRNALISKEPDHLFNFKKTIAIDFSEEESSKELKKIFENNKVHLSNNFIISNIDKYRWSISDGPKAYSIVAQDDLTNYIVFEEDRPVEISLYINLPSQSDKDPKQMNRSFAGTFQKQNIDEKQSVYFDITKKAKSYLRPASSFTIILHDDNGTLKFDDIELSLFMKR